MSTSCHGWKKRYPIPSGTKKEVWNDRQYSLMVREQLWNQTTGVQTPAIHLPVSPFLYLENKTIMAPAFKAQS